jgi:hypothetical protein
MDISSFFLKPNSIAQKQYEALRLFFIENVPAIEVAKKFGYTYRGFTTIASDFRKKIKNGLANELFFTTIKKGRKRPAHIQQANEIIISLRKTNHSVEEIKTILDSKGYKICEKTIHNILKEEGFSKLPRRTKANKSQLQIPQIPAEKSISLKFEQAEEFKSASAGILCLLPYIEKYGIRKIIEESDYPYTSQISRLSSILSFVALKASNARRYTADNMWCMDRGSGLFAGLNVLPKAAWFTSYSHRVTSAMNRNILLKLNKKWISEGLMGDTANLDFTTIPYWGDGEHLENNWSGKRGKALSSMLAVLAHDPDSGIIDYGDVNVLHKDESAVVLEFLDFYRNSSEGADDLKYLVFDSKFTNYENLSKINSENVKFVTIRRRGKNIVERLENIPKSSWKTIRVEASANKKRTLHVFDEVIELKGYNGKIRQISVTGHGKIKPAIVITNDFAITTPSLIRKYSKRWLIEKEISEQISFFHLNNVSSSMVIKVDFDLTMSILTHNLFRLFANDLQRYEKLSDQSLYDKFLINSADIDINIENKKITVKYKKKRNLPLLLETMNKYNDTNYRWLSNNKMHFEGASYS